MVRSINLKKERVMATLSDDFNTIVSQEAPGDAAHVENAPHKWLLADHCGYKSSESYSFFAPRQVHPALSARELIDAGYVGVFKINK